MNKEELKKQFDDLESLLEEKKRQLSDIEAQIDVLKNDGNNELLLKAKIQEKENAEKEIKRIEEEKNKSKEALDNYVEDSSSEMGMTPVNKESLPVVEVYEDENGNKYLDEENYKRLIKLETPEESYSINGIDGKYYSLSKYESDTVLARNSLNSPYAFNALKKNVDSSNIKLNENTEINTSAENNDETLEQSNENNTQDNQVEDEEKPKLSSSDLEYKKLLEKRVSIIQKEISRLQLIDGKDPFNHNLVSLQGYQLELEVLNQMISELDHRPEENIINEASLSALDDRRILYQKKQEDYRKQIKELESMRQSLLTARAKRKADNRIKRINKKIEKMKKRDVRCGKIQRSILYPKYLYETKKRSLITHAAGRVQAYEMKANDNQVLRDEIDLNPGIGFIDDIKRSIYDIKGIYYQKKIERSKEIFDEVQSKNHIVTMYGARVTSLSKKYIENIRQKNEEQYQLSDGAVATI